MPLTNDRAKAADMLRFTGAKLAVFILSRGCDPRNLVLNQIPFAQLQRLNTTAGRRPLAW